MKKANRLPLWIFAALFALVLALFCGIAAGSGNTASAASYATDGTYVKSYKIDCDIKNNREINIVETIQVYYYNNSGFFRDIPVNGGEKVRNLKVSQENNKDLYYNVTYEDNFVVIEVDDDRLKTGETITYVLQYDYLLTKAQEGDNILEFNPVGTGFEKDVYNVEILMNLPSGYLNGKCYKGAAGSSDEYAFESTESANGTAVSTSIPFLERNKGVTFYLEFEDGSLTTYFDFTPYWFILTGAALFVIIILLKLLCFNKNTLTPVVNFEAPNQMNPLMMGKLIDNKINSEDITAMIFYFADKGWLKINLDNQKDPLLIRIAQNLPESCDNYEKLMFDNIFGKEYSVRTSSLKYSFYRTVEKVSAMVNTKTKGLYSSGSLGISIIFAILGGLLLGITPLLIAVTQVSSTLLILTPFLALLPALFIYALTETIKYNSLKWKKKTKLLFCLPVALICAVLTGAYMLFVPNFLIGYLPKALLCIICCICIISSVFLISKTKSYKEQLNQIVGFKNFILLAEKDRLEMLLEDDPQFYYHVLPYAQVLGVSDKWEEKFEDITVAPPKWVTSSTLDNIIEFHLLNSIIRTSSVKMSTNFNSRPSSSSGSGFKGFGGHGGGHVGGGHGGGGMRFK